METTSTAKNVKVITIRKPNYFVLVLPVGVLLLTVWLFLLELVSTPEPIAPPQEIGSLGSPFGVIVLGLAEILVLGVTAQKIYRDKKRLVVNDVGVIAWVTSMFITELGDYLNITGLSFFSLLLWDFIAALMIVTLLHDEPFAGISLYQNKRIIVRE